MKKMRTFLALSLVLLTLGCVTGGGNQEQKAAAVSGEQSVEKPGPSESYFSGDGGKGLRLAVLEPTGKGLSINEQWMLSLVQGSITGDFNKYSAMTIIDRQNLEKILAEQSQSLSGNYSEDDYIRIGALTNARLILTGVISRTANNYMLELSVTDAESGERKASYPPKPVSAAALENLSAVKEASADLLGQLGVKLTDRGLRELKAPVNTVEVQAEAALARGITAQRQGTEVAALSYYFQAAALNPNLLEATNRSSIINANITSGNIGADARNDIQWRRDWIDRLTETEKYFDDFFKTASLPYTLFYSTAIAQGTINYQNETMTLSIETILHGSQIWTVSVERALQAVFEGLDATKRKEAWGLDKWPQQNVSSLNPFRKQSKNFSVAIELVNSRDQIIGRQTLQTQGAWEFSINKGLQILVSPDDIKTVNFANVKVSDITDSMTIRIANINGENAQTVAQRGVLQVQALLADEWKFSKVCLVKNGILTGLRDRSTRADGALVIQAIWLGEPVTSIANAALSNSRLTSVTISGNITSIGVHAFSDNQLTSVIISGNVASIEEGAFRNNQLTSITISGNVASIGPGAFRNNQLTSITISGNVASIGPSAFRDNQLTSVIIPDSVTSIGSGAFMNNRLTSVTIPDSITSISPQLFENNQLTNFTIPETITAIGEGAFRNNPLTAITIPNRVTTIGRSAFADTQLESVLIGVRVASIGSSAFSARSLTRIAIPANVNLDGGSFPRSFASRYYEYQRKAGVYIFREWSSGGLNWGLTGERYPFR
jgi:hypothetical protein